MAWVHDGPLIAAREVNRCVGVLNCDIAKEFRENCFGVCGRISEILLIEEVFEGSCERNFCLILCFSSYPNRCQDIN